jgi:AcrR family transcriptional regulator
VAPSKTADAPPLGKQAAKSRRTQEAILNAVIELINEGGFAAASSTQIARRAGVSWGAVQHHFGSKEDILEAVLARSHTAFAERLGDERYTRGKLETRVDRFVDAAWGHYQGNEYPAAMEILLATRARRGEGQGGIQFDHRAHLQLWRSVFHELTLSDARMQEAIYTVHLMLTGILIQSLLEPADFAVPRYLKRLKRIVLGMLRE